MSVDRILDRASFPLFGGFFLAGFVALKVLARLARVGRREPRTVPRRILLLAHDPPEQAGTRFRLTEWAERLRARGLIVDLLHPNSDRELSALYGPVRRRMEALAAITFSRRLRQVLLAGRYDAVVYSRNAFPRFPYGGPVMDRLLGAVNPRTFLDIDDALWAYPRPAPRPGFVAGILARLTDPERSLRAMASVHGVLAGSPNLLEQARRCNPRSHLLPTCVDPRAVPAHRHEALDRPVVGWIGTTGNLPHLDLVTGALAGVAGRRPFRLRVVSSAPFVSEGLEVENVTWSAGTEAQAVAGFDLGLMPLRDGPAFEGKCGLKLLQYAAAGIPAVASPVGVNRDIVRHGETGFLAGTQEEWKEAVETLLGDHALRERLGRAARENAIRRWSYDAWEPALLAALGIPS